MEAVDPAVEAAVLWLLETILGVLLGDKMQAWIRQVGLADDIEGLKSEIERAEAAVAAVKGRVTGNKPLARSLGRLKELLYNADDMVDELDYYRLQHQVEGGTIAWANQSQDTDAIDGAQLVDGTRDNSGIPDRKKRSKAWEEFRVTEKHADGKPKKAECIHCHTAVRCESSNGTSVLRNHLKSESCKRKRAANGQTPNHSSVADGAQNGATAETHDSNSRKRMRIDELSAHNMAAKAQPWSKNDFCNRIQQTSRQLQEAVSEVEKLYGSGSVASSNPCQSTAADPCRRTSSLVQCKVYGRVAEKNSILQLITEGTSDGVLILPIVGIAGIGKTALAQLVYNDPIVKSQFDHRIWIWVSNNSDIVRLTIEMLDFVSQEKHEGISSLAKLQEILVSHVTSKRCLLILDDVWDDMDDHTWNKLLAPMLSDNTKRNAILVTTRKLSIANATGTVEPIKLGAMQNPEFSLLFKACAFGDDNHEGHPSLNIIGRQIADKLYGNPLAAETVGILLRAQLTVDHWSNILKNEKWKSLHLSRGLMSALKLSYDELPYYLQKCFLCCSIFPQNHQFPSNELINIWISQGFVKCSHSTERLEDVGWEYLTDLVNLCFFEQVEAEEPSTFDQPCYVMPDLVHDFARLVSRTECAVIDGLECNEMLPTIRHLSLLTDSVYHEAKHGNVLRNMRFEEKMRCLGTLVRKLRSLVLIGKYDSFFFQSFQDVFHKAPNLRVLQISATHADFDLFLHNSVCSIHLRYVKLKRKGSREALPLPLSKFYHLQVIDVGNSAICNNMNGLVSMRHLVVEKGTHFTDQHSTCFEMTQLQTMNELVQLGVHQLQNVNGAEACGAKLRDKQHLEKLHLLWNYTLSLDEFFRDTRSESCSDTESEVASGPMNGVNNSITSEQFTDAETEVLQGLEPNRNLKHLLISGYSGATSPNWFSSYVSVTCLQTLHLENCRKLQVLPSLEMLPFLIKLKLVNMWKVREVSIPLLEELVLILIPKLKRCSCNSVWNLNSSLRVLVIEKCHELKVFPLFESCGKFRIKQKSWLSSLCELTIHDCPQLIVSNPLPPSSSACKLSISRISGVPTMHGSSNGKLIIGVDSEGEYDESSNELMKLDENNFAFHNLRALTHLEINLCENPMFVSGEGFRHLISLKSLEIYGAGESFCSDVLPEHTHLGMAAGKFNAFPALKRLSIESTRISGKWLSVMLRHAPSLEELELRDCDQISGLLIEGRESYLLNHNSIPRSSSPGRPDDAWTSSSRESLLHIPSNLLSSLKKMLISRCQALAFQGNKEGFSAFTSLEELEIWSCPKLISSLVLKDENSGHANQRRRLSYSPGEPGIVEFELSLAKLQLYPRGSLNCLKKLEIRFGGSDLESLVLDSCTALEELVIGCCYRLTALEGIQSLRGLRYLEVYNCLRLPPVRVRLSGQVNELFPQLDRLHIDDYSFLTACWNLTDLPVCLRSLTSLKRLEIHYCRRISRLPEKGLPPYLEELVIDFCNLELAEQCRGLATNMLKPSHRPSLRFHPSSSEVVAAAARVNEAGGLPSSPAGSRPTPEPESPWRASPHYANEGRRPSPRRPTPPLARMRPAAFPRRISADASPPPVLEPESPRRASSHCANEGRRPYPRRSCPDASCGLPPPASPEREADGLLSPSPAGITRTRSRRPPPPPSRRLLGSSPPSRRRLRCFPSSCESYGRQDPCAEAAVLWLAQTILEVLLAGKMEAWIRQIGLADDIEVLKSEIERVEAVVPDVKGRAIGNRPLARSLGRLKELLYDADDMVDELDYYRLQHQVEGDSRKRMRIDEVSTHSTAANAHTWDENDFCNRIQQTSRQLQKAVSEVEKLYRSGSVASSNPCQSTAADPCRRTSSLVHCKMYGRVAEKNSVLQMITEGTSDGVLILPIVGIAGIGKTALAQLVYNDPIVRSQFDHRIWIWVSKNFDVARLTIEMLDFKKHEGISSLAKLQEILVSHVTSKRCLLIFDDVWDDMDDHTWNKLLAPMKSDIGTVEPIKLGALQNEDFSLLFKACALGDDNHEGHPSLNIIGRQIADKLYGNPLAAMTVGILLRAYLTVDHWSNILKNEKWKSLTLLSYDDLPYYLQQCFLYCSIFPNNNQFSRNELINIWISQGLVKCGHSMERLEEIGRGYLTDLVNLCFFEQVEAKEPSTDDQPCYVMPGLVHDFARLVSRTECATIDGLECNEMLPTIRHLSILTDSVCHEDKHGLIVRDMEFEEKMQCLGASVRKLRSLVLIGKYDSFFFQSFQDVFHKAPNLRVLQISATHADFDLFLHNLVCSTHLHYVKLKKKGNSEALPIPLSKFYHLQVIDVGNSALSNDMNGLVSTHHLVVENGTHFTDQHSICFEMAQLQMMSELVQLGVHQLQNVSGAEASGAKLRDKQHLEKLQLSWNYTVSDEQFTDAAREVLQGLEPNRNLKHLRISGYSATTSPNWLSSIVSVTCLQTLHLEDCTEWQVLPSLEMLPFLTKLEFKEYVESDSIINSFVGGAGAD
ncbi:hypothetical protein U9M48_033869 [Paspalum notatum var. saurae]|uniref:BED-type domain-containing protein n=1 Tax=Paspalum notatum var. saurae TaxID=547442 RepID=A0AAQ3U9H7_PASNO